MIEQPKLTDFTDQPFGDLEKTPENIKNYTIALEQFVDKKIAEDRKLILRMIHSKVSNILPAGMFTINRDKFVEKWTEEFTTTKAQYDDTTPPETGTQENTET